MQIGLKFLILCAVTTGANSEIFTSLGQMKDIMVEELNFIKMIDEYLYKEENKIRFMKDISTKLKQNTKEILNDLDNYLSHPINQYHLLNRVSSGWGSIIRAIHDDHSRDFFNNQFNKIRNIFPNEDDITGSVKALMRLQDTYQLTTHDLSEGDIKGSKSFKKLSLEEVFNIGVTAYINNDYYHCVLWMSEARSRSIAGEKGPNMFEILDHLSFCLSQQGYLEAAFILTKDMLQIDPTHDRIITNLHLYKNMLDARGIKEVGSVRLDNLEHHLLRPDLAKKGDYHLEYERLCRSGSDATPSWMEKQLSCIFWTNNDPWLLIQPVKAEILWKGPDLVRFYDVISNAEIEYLKSIIKPRLKRATVNNPNSGGVQFTDYRVSKSGWLPDHEFNVVNKISRRIEAITGLSLTTAEDLQIANYGVGGQYEPHFDYADKNHNNSFLDEQGNRMATWLFYFSDVPFGGATVFLYPKLAVQPIKGSAVFWYNLLPSGEGDKRTRHAACPVLLGIKWAGNKWIHERGQEFRRKCGLTIYSDNIRWP